MPAVPYLKGAARLIEAAYSTRAPFGMDHQLHGAIPLPDGTLHLLVSFVLVAPVVHPDGPRPREDGGILDRGAVVECVRTSKRPALDDVERGAMEGAHLIEPGLLVVVR